MKKKIQETITNKYCLVYDSKVVEIYGKELKKHLLIKPFLNASSARLDVVERDEWLRIEINSRDKQVMLFDSVYHAQMFLLLNSNMSQSKEWIPFISKTKLAKIIAKGKYMLTRFNISCLTSDRPFLCEILICEYDVVNNCLV